MDLKIISAGAGSGKTYRLTQELTQMLRGGVRPSGVIATTFTQMAAVELQERVRVKLLEDGFLEAANELSNALIGTVHGLGVKLLQRFAFEMGISPDLSVMADEDQQTFFNLAMANVLEPSIVQEIDARCHRLGLDKRDQQSFDWRHRVRQIADLARVNCLDEVALQESASRSTETLFGFLPPPLEQDWASKLVQILDLTIRKLSDNEDNTRKTGDALKLLKQQRQRLQRGETLNWYEWARVAKLDVGAKSREEVAELVELAKQVEAHPDFQEDIKQHIHRMFDLAACAIREYDRFKSERGLIDYIDMETMVNAMLDHPSVQQTLSEEVDLLMVDEFQDTSPIQLSIFWKLSRIARKSVWVGDPKQSIYGFRGADPAIMRQLIDKAGGVQPENIQRHSWRSRQDLVHLTNALFTQAFQDLPEEQIALFPKRLPIAGVETANRQDEPPGMTTAFRHWHFDFEGNRPPRRIWMNRWIARQLTTFLAQSPLVFDKKEAKYRPVEPGDIAILCRSNRECEEMAQSLAAEGLRVAITRKGLLDTAEVALVLACLKYILNEKDSLSVAEIMLLSGAQSLPELIEDRLAFIEQRRGGSRWGQEVPMVSKLDELRGRVADLSASELLNLLLENLHLSHLLVGWGKERQRLGNLDALRKLALDYEEKCNRLHTAASLGGFLLWLQELQKAGADEQAAGTGPDAVNVLTYHKSKGLEWPVVICASLEQKLRDGLYGLSMQSGTIGLDVNNILADRWIRLWLNPYADQHRKMPLTERLEQSEAQERATREALQEEARLLYVGITRARDYLVFPSREKRPTRWLNRVFHQGEEQIPALDAAQETPTFLWKDRAIPVLTTIRHMSTEEEALEEAPEKEQTAASWPLPRGPVKHTRYWIDAYRDVPEVEEWPSFREYTLSVPPISQPEGVVPAQLGKVLKAAVNSVVLSETVEERRQKLVQILKNGGATHYLGLEPLMLYSGSFLDFLAQQTQEELQGEWRKYPVRAQFGDRAFHTVIDRLRKDAGGWKIIQNSAHRGASGKWKQKARELRTWAWYTAQALRQVEPEGTIEVYLHFTWMGKIVQVYTME